LIVKNCEVREVYLMTPSLTGQCNSGDDEYAVGVVIFAPIYRRMSTLRTVRIETINFTLSLIFSEVGVMNPHLMLELRVDCESHLRVLSEAYTMGTL
jgi:hypothetical protein